jgi:hypothetical protein
MVCTRKGIFRVTIDVFKLTWAIPDHQENLLDALQESDDF